MSEFIVRALRPEDVSSVVETVRLVYEEYGFTWDPDGYHVDLYQACEVYGPPDAAFWVAEAACVIGGCVGLCTFNRVPGKVGEVVEDSAGLRRVAGCDSELVRLYVRPDWRRRGAGRALTVTAMEWARARGCTAIELWSDKRFDRAHRLYESLGARIVGDRICDDPDVSPEWGLILETGR